MARSGGLVNLFRYLEDREPPCVPSVLTRSDGLGLLYPGRLNMIIGEPESGKTWLAMAAISEVLGSGGTAMLIDFEDEPRGTIDRLRALGVADDDMLERLDYAQPASDDQLAELAEHEVKHPHQLVVVDSMNEMLAVLGINANDNTDVTFAVRTALRPLAQPSGAAVLVLDHVTKANGGTNRFPVGAQAKKAVITGAAYEARIVRPLGRGLSGSVRLTTIKDRPGFVRGSTLGRGNPNHAGLAVLDSYRDGNLEWRIEPDSSGQGGTFRPTTFMSRIAEFLEANPGASKKQIEDAVKGKTDAKRRALECLEDEGFAVRVDQGGPAHRYKLARPFPN